MTKVITVPKNPESELALNRNEATNDHLIELHLDTDAFYTLCSNGFFDELNHLTGANIDDHEDDFIKGDENLHKAIQFIENSLKKHIDHQVLLLELKQLFEEALKRKTGVYFYF